METLCFPAVSLTPGASTTMVFFKGKDSGSSRDTAEAFTGWPSTISVSFARSTSSSSKATRFTDVTVASLRRFLNEKRAPVAECARLPKV